MLRSAVSSLVLCLAVPAWAEDWRGLDTAGITKALTARVLGYEDGSTQNFFEDGRTLYRAGGGEAWGKWWVEGDQYCSTWPPSDVAACYAVEAQGLEVRFTSGSGEVSVGRYQDL
jgi:hypothetical protein